jgi:RES domain-containing protein
MKADGESRKQAFAWRLKAAGHHGLMVCSFAPGAGLDDLNLVLWSWGDSAPARLALIDDEGRLSR